MVPAAAQVPLSSLVPAHSLGYDLEMTAGAEHLGVMSYAEYLAFERSAETKHEYIERAPDDGHAATNPRLIAEVLSDSTEAYDRGDKWRDYRRLASLQTYVLVSQTEPLVEVYRRSGDVWQYQAAGPGQRLQLDQLDHGLSLDIDALYHSGLTD